MIARSLWRARAKLAFAATAISGGLATAAVATSDDPSMTLKICTAVPIRLVRLSFTAATIAFDYKYSLWGTAEGSPENANVKHEVHLRSAHRLRDLCFKNGGIYIKLGQHIGQLEYVVPQEYVQTMREYLLNKCPVSSYDEVCEVLEKELGDSPEKIFADFDQAPIASASLAQVHVARTHDGQKVAVKVQHAHMTDTAAADHASVRVIVNSLYKIFPSFDYRWLVDEISESLPKELDFLVEAKNSEKCLANFRKLSPHIADSVYAPKVYWNLSTSKLLTMEFMDGVHVNDVQAIKGLGIQPIEVAKLVSLEAFMKNAKIFYFERHIHCSPCNTPLPFDWVNQAFAEMMFKHGFVHCDPHAANLLVRPMPSSKINILGKRKPQLVLLDHGLYKELDFNTRFSYAGLWKGLIFADPNAIKENSAKLGAGEDLYALFAGILTMKPWNRVIDPALDHLAIQGSESERSELQMYASDYFPQISELLRRLPRVVLLLMKTNDCLRSVSSSLLQGSSLETFFIVGKVSSEAVMEEKSLRSRSVLRRINARFDGIMLEARFLAMQIALWLFQLKRALSW